MKLSLTPTLSNQEISQIFSFIAQVMGMDPANRFKARAYEEAAVVVSHLDYELHQRFRQITEAEFLKELDALPSIGLAISQKLTELFSTGNIKAFQEIVAPFPAGMYPLMKIHGIGAKKALVLTTHFKLDDQATAVNQLLAKAQAGQVRNLEGFGDKSEQDLIVALQEQHQKARIPYKKALSTANTFIDAIKQSKHILKIEFLGSLRRGAETVGDIDLGVAAEDSAQVTEDIKKLPLVNRVLSAGENLVSVIGKSGWQVDIKYAPLDSWGSFIQHFTGDKQHNIKLREIAIKKGLSLSEHGIKDKATGKTKKFASEEAFYNFLGFTWIPPAERVGGSEFEKYKVTTPP